MNALKYNVPLASATVRYIPPPPRPPHFESATITRSLNSTQYVRRAFLALPLVLLTACGDGGGGGSTTTAGNRPEPQPPGPVSAPAITDSGTLSGFSYGLWNEPAASGSRNLRADILSRNNEVNPDYVGRDFNNNRRLDLTYQDDNGFVGIYSHEGRTGKITSDIYLELTINSAGAYVSDFVIGIENPIVIEGQNLGMLDGLAGFVDITSNGTFRDNNDLGIFSEVLYSSGSIEGAFSDQDTAQDNPSLVAGEVKVRYGDRRNQTKNSLVGVFAAGPDE